MHFIRQYYRKNAGSAINIITMKDRDLTNIWESYKQSKTEQTSEEVINEAHCTPAHRAKKVKEGALDDLKKKADLDDDGKISGYEKKKADAILKNDKDKDIDKHICALKVEHADWGLGTPIHARHAEPDENGHVSWYAVMFEHGTEVVDTVDVAVLDESSHGSHKKK